MSLALLQFPKTLADNLWNKSRGKKFEITRNQSQWQRKLQVKHTWHSRSPRNPICNRKVSATFGGKEEPKIQIGNVVWLWQYWNSWVCHTTNWGIVKRLWQVPTRCQPLKSLLEGYSQSHQLWFIWKQKEQNIVEASITQWDVDPRGFFLWSSCSKN